MSVRHAWPALGGLLLLLLSTGFALGAASPTATAPNQAPTLNRGEQQDRTVELLTRRVEALERQAQLAVSREQSAAHRAIVAINVLLSLVLVVGGALLFFGARGIRDIRRVARHIRATRAQTEEQLRALPAVDITGEITPELATTLSDLGRRLDQLEEFGQPLEASDCIARGNAWYAQGDYSRAASWYNRAVAEAPDSPDAHYRRGIALQRLGKHEEALASLERVTELNPTDPEAPYVKGLVLQQLGRHGEAVAAFTRTLALSPQWIRAYLGRAASFSQLRQSEKALADLTTAVSLDPTCRDQVGASAAFAWLHEAAGYRRLMETATATRAA